MAQATEGGGQADQGQQAAGANSGQQVRDERGDQPRRDRDRDRNRDRDRKRQPDGGGKPGFLRDRNRDDQKRGDDRRKGHGGDDRRREERGGPPPMRSASPPKKGADPDSPFAALGALKQALEKQAQDPKN